MKGKFTGKIIIGSPTPLSREDLPTLAQGGRTTTSVQRIRASHHKIARLLAHGLTHKEVAAVTGYTSMRVGQLAGSPAMQELIAVYRDRDEEREDAQLDPVTELMANNLLVSQRQIADQLADADERDETLPIRTLLAVAADSADRLGYSKHTSQTNVNLTFGADLERAIARSGKVINSVVNKPLPATQPKALVVFPPKQTPSAAVPPRPLISRRA